MYEVFGDICKFFSFKIAIKVKNLKCPVKNAPHSPSLKKASNRRMVNKLRRKKDVFLRNKYSPVVIHIIVFCMHLKTIICAFFERAVSVISRNLYLIKC